MAAGIIDPSKVCDFVMEFWLPLPMKIFVV